MELKEAVQEKEVQKIALSYYARKDVQKAIFDFCKNRETVPRYVETFGKRPDALDYPADILNHAKNGATSFHCSEELWENPLSISKEASIQEMNNLRIGWDFLIDIDSKYLDYSKIAAELIIKALEFHGIKNVGIKFSGSKGFHLIIPWKAFPKEINGIQLKDKFPEWPRLIANYIKQMIHDKLTERIMQISTIKDIEKKGEISEVVCKKCGNKATTQILSLYKCTNCKAEMKSPKSIRKIIRCHNCNADMNKTGEENMFACLNCNLSSTRNPENFEERFTSKGLIDTADIVLVSPRHLFRAPYSLHEKTALASIVIDKKDVPDFQPKMADPFKIQIKDFTPDSQENEARELLIQAVDLEKRKEKDKKEFSGKSIDVKNLTIKESMFPDCIKQILQGMKDGKKRALFILLAFFRSLEFPRDYVEAKIEEWNKKNNPQLREGYIRSQIEWFSKNKIMPPNCDKPIYKEIGIQCSCKSKNPINYTIRGALKFKK